MGNQKVKILTVVEVDEEDITDRYKKIKTTSLDGNYHDLIFNHSEKLRLELNMNYVLIGVDRNPEKPNEISLTTYIVKPE